MHNPRMTAPARRLRGLLPELRDEGAGVFRAQVWIGKQAIGKIAGRRRVLRIVRIGPAPRVALGCSPRGATPPGHPGHAERHDVPLPSLEGFVRQVIGWREYVWGRYWQWMPEYRSANQLGAERDLPPAYSADRGFAYFGAPPDDTGVTIFVGDDPGELREHFGSVREVTSVRSPGVEHVVWICTDRRIPWSQIWPEYRNL